MGTTLDRAIQSTAYVIGAADSGSVKDASYMAFDRTPVASNALRLAQAQLMP